VGKDHCLTNDRRYPAEAQWGWLNILLAYVAALIFLAALGIWLEGTVKLTSSKAALAWAIFTIVLLFGAGFAMMTKHSVEIANGETQSGVNEPPPTR